MNRPASRIVSLLLAALLAPVSAHAAFGKRDSNEARSSGTHQAVPASAPRSTPTASSGSFGRRSSPAPTSTPVVSYAAAAPRPARVVEPVTVTPPPVFAEPAVVYIGAPPVPPVVVVEPAPIVPVAPVVVASPPPVVVVEPAPVAPVVVAPARPVVVEQAPPPVHYVVAAPEPTGVPHVLVGLDGQGFVGGGSFGFHLLAEGEKLGFQVNGASVLTSLPDSGEVDQIRVFDIHLTYAALASERARLRIEIGLSGASAVDLAVVGPDFGVSGALNLDGPLGLQASIASTPFPYRRVDATALVTLTFRPFEVHGGWKYLLLDDAGLIGDRHVSTFNGPYVGCGFAF